jgi:hypothetical protein
MAERDFALRFATLASDDRPRMFGEDKVWLLKRGTARVDLSELDTARAD